MTPHHHHPHPTYSRYSFALISWELAYGKKPYGGMNIGAHHQVVCLEGGRPPLDDRARPPEFNQLIAECW